MSHETQLNEPIKIKWSGKLRTRLHERNKAYAAEEESLRPDRFVRTVSRQKTNVVIETLEEAKAVVEVLDRFYGPGYQRSVTWANGAMASSAERITNKIKSNVAEQGYEL